MRSVNPVAKQFLWLLLLAGCAPEPRATGPEAAAAGKTRVLYVDGYPRWGYRYLKNALIRDASLQIHCFLASADPAFPQECSIATDDPKFKAPLASLPSTIEGLLEYDVVILGDVGPASWPAGAAGLLREFVEKHGRAVVIMSGQGHMPKDWKGTELDAVLPVEFEAEPGEASGETGYRLTEAGRKSPLVAFGREEADATELWEDRDGRGDGLPRVSWAVATKRKAGAQTLVEAGPVGHPIPLFVTMNCGLGRVFFSATDEMWRSRFRTGDEPYFLPFWRRVIEWGRKGE